MPIDLIVITFLDTRLLWLEVESQKQHNEETIIAHKDVGASCQPSGYVFCFTVWPNVGKRSGAVKNVCLWNSNYATVNPEKPSRLHQKRNTQGSLNPTETGWDTALETKTEEGENVPWDGCCNLGDCYDLLPTTYALGWLTFWSSCCNLLLLEADLSGEDGGVPGRSGMSSCWTGVGIWTKIIEEKQCVKGRHVVMNNLQLHTRMRA